MATQQLWRITLHAALGEQRAVGVDRLVALLQVGRGEQVPQLQRIAVRLAVAAITNMLP